MNRVHQVRLKAELDAIDAWDENYQRDKTHSETDEVAFRIRQARRREIVRKITSLGGSVSFVNRQSASLVKKRRGFLDMFCEDAFPNDA